MAESAAAEKSFKTTITQTVFDYLPLLIFVPICVTAFAIPCLFSNINSQLQNYNTLSCDKNATVDFREAEKTKILKQCIKYGFVDEEHHNIPSFSHHPPSSTTDCLKEINKTAIKFTAFCSLGICTFLTFFCAAFIKFVGKESCSFLSPQNSLQLLAEIPTYICSLFILNGFVFYIVCYCIYQVL